MEIVLVWCLWYAMYRAVKDTSANTVSLLRGRQVTPRGRAAGPDAAVRPGYVGRGLGTLAALAWESLAAGWRTGWAEGRADHDTHDGWRPWREPTTPPPANASEPAGPRPADAGGARPRRRPTTNPHPRPAAGGDREGSRGDEAPPAGPQSPGPAPTITTDPDPEGTGAGTSQAPDLDDVLDAELGEPAGLAVPMCWSDLTGAEQAEVTAAARDRWGAPWDRLTVHQCAAAVRDWINDRYGIALTSKHVLDAQASRDDPTWLSGPAVDVVDVDPLDSDLVALTAGSAPAPPGTGTPHPQGAAAMTTHSGETTNLSSSRAYYEELETHATDAIAGQIELSKATLSVAEMGDVEVMTAIATAHETAMKLAGDARAVLAALEPHRVMEEAVAAVPGAANTPFYRQ